LTAASCPKKDFYSRPKKVRKKVGKKGCKKDGKKDIKKGSKRHQKRWHKKQQERQQKSLFLNLTCCCLETGLKPVLLFLECAITDILKKLPRRKRNS